MKRRVCQAYNAPELSQAGRTSTPAEETVVGLQVSTRVSSDVTILDLEGRVIIGPGSDTLGKELRRILDGGWRKVLVNFGGVTQIDSSGIATLVRTYVTLTRSGGSLKLLGVTGRVREVLSITRLLAAIPNFDDEATALRSFL